MNNVGIDDLCSFEDQDDEKIVDLLAINSLSLTLLTKKFLRGLKARQLRQKGLKSGILNVASFAGELPCPYFAVYGATKAYVIHFTKCLKIENPELDIMALNPSEVSTQMTMRPPDIMTISSEDCARGVLRDMG